MNKKTGYLNLVELSYPDLVPTKNVSVKSLDIRFSESDGLCLLDFKNGDNDGNALVILKDGKGVFLSSSRGLVLNRGWHEPNFPSQEKLEELILENNYNAVTFY